MKLNHTGHEVYKCARVTGHTKKFVFQWFEFVCYINVICCICKIYIIDIYGNVWFQCKISAASYPDVSLDVRAKEGGKETTGETSGRSCFQDGGKNNGGPIYNF